MRRIDLSTLLLKHGSIVTLVSEDETERTGIVVLSYTDGECCYSVVYSNGQFIDYVLYSEIIDERGTWFGSWCEVAGESWLYSDSC